MDIEVCCPGSLPKKVEEKKEDEKKEDEKDEGKTNGQSAQQSQSGTNSTIAQPAAQRVRREERINPPQKRTRSTLELAIWGGIFLLGLVAARIIARVFAEFG